MADFPNFSTHSGLLDAIPAGVFTLDLEGRITSWNGEAERLTGYSREEVLGEPCALFVSGSPGEDGPPSHDPPPGEGPMNTWSTLRRKDGEERVVSRTARDLLDETGSVMGVMECFVDVTAVWDDARSSAEHLTHVLEESRARLQGFVDATSDLVTQVDDQGKLLFVNRAAKSVYGLSPEECLGKQAFDFVHPDDRQETMAAFQGWIQNGVGHAEFENRQVSVDGSVTHMLWSIDPRYGADGELLNIWAIARDVTQRRVEEDRSRTILRTALDGFWLVDARGGRILQVNPAYVHMSGYTEAELLSMKVSDLDVEEEPEESSWRIQAVVEEGARRFETRHRKKDGSIMEVEVSARYLDSGGGRIFVFLQDITPRKAAEAMLVDVTADLRRSNEELQQFAYVASHDLQEPLRMVASYTQLLEDRYGDQLGGDAGEFMGYVVEGAKRMQRLIDSLLDYSRVTTSAKAPEPVDSEDALLTALRNLSSLISDQEGVVTHDALPLVLADPGQLTRVFQNLVGNALKYRGEDAPRVHVSAEPSPQEWVFSVSDNGMGIDEEYRDQIFAIFQRLHGRDSFGGSGIGLSICKRIIERHGGTIWCESGPDGGTIFRFTLSSPEARDSDVGGRRTDG